MKPSERRQNTPAERRRIARATIIWGVVALSGTTLVAVLAIWHLIRRGRLIQASLGPPKARSGLDLPHTDPA